MRRIVGGMFVSLDGVIQAPGGPTEDPTDGFLHGGWMFPVSDDQVDTAIGAFFSQPYDLLWPYADGEVAAQVSRYCSLVRGLIWPMSIL